MPAENYRICCALFGAYIAKVSKRNPNTMLEDRREITDSEILTLMDWFLDSKLEEGEDTITFSSGIREGYKVEISYVKE